MGQLYLVTVSPTAKSRSAILWPSGMASPAVASIGLLLARIFPEHLVPGSISTTATPTSSWGSCTRKWIIPSFLSGLWPGRLQAPERDMLGFEKTVESFRAQLAAPAAVPDAAEGSVAGGWRAVVHADGAGFERFGAAQDARVVAGHDVGAQAVGRSIGAVKGFLLGFKRADRGNGSESLFAHAERAFG